jgi:hypothetical protein
MAYRDHARPDHDRDDGHEYPHRPGHKSRRSQIAVMPGRVSHYPAAISQARPAGPTALRRPPMDRARPGRSHPDSRNECARPGRKYPDGHSDRARPGQ